MGPRRNPSRLRPSWWPPRLLRGPDETVESCGPRLLLAVAGTWAVVFLAWPAAPDAMLVDDAWYYLRTAKNVVDGYGVSFDRVELFNGFHPLWLLTLIPLGTLKLGPDGLARMLSVTVFVQRAGDGAIEFWASQIRDITTSKQLQSELAHQATHDSLTGLPNRTLMLRTLSEALERARPHLLQATRLPLWPV